MFFWSSFPFVRFVIPFALGILLGHTFNVEFSIHSLGLWILILFLLLWASHHINKKFRFQWVNGVLVFCLLCCLGVLHFDSSKGHVRLPKINGTENKIWVGRVESVQKKSRVIESFVAEVSRIGRQGSWEKVNFKVLVYNQDSTLTLYPNDVFVTAGDLRSINEIKNPGQFNYKNYLERKGIYYSAFGNNYSIKPAGFSFDKLGVILRDQVESIYRKVGLSKQELGVLIALTLGDKSLINVEDKRAFAGAGAMHILAVSGLHVGIVFLLFNILLKRLPNTRFFVVLRGVILIIVIWGFALITGFSPSVQRAGWMFSFIILAPVFQRSTNVINSICLSAFLILCLNPNALFELGFQLSYSAVLGIVLIHPIVYRWWVIKNYVLDKLWSLMVVSLAAQLATLPLTLLYFHQFPNYFLLTNAFVIPLAFLIVFLAIIIVVIFLVVGAHFSLGDLLEFLLRSLNYFISTVIKLPCAVTENLWISPLSAIGLIMSIGFLIAYLHQINKRYLFGFLLSLLVCCLLELGVDVKNLSRRQTTFYSTSSGFMMSHVEGLKGDVFYSGGIEDVNSRVFKDHLGSIGAEISVIHWLGENVSNQLIYINQLDVFLSENSENCYSFCANINKLKAQNYYLVSKSTVASLVFLKSKKKQFLYEKNEQFGFKQSFWIKH